MISETLLEILCCPKTHLPLLLLTKEQVASVNRKINNQELTTVVGDKVTETIDGGLYEQTNRVLYPIKDDIPILLVEEGITINAQEVLL